MRRFRTIRAVAFAFAGAISVAVLVTGAGVYFALVGAVDRQVDRRLRAEANELLADAPNRATLIERITREQQARDSGDIGFELRDARGTRRAGNMLLAAPLPRGLSGVDARAGIVGLSRGRALVLGLPAGDTLTLVIESEPIDHHDHRRLTILAIGFGTVLLLVLLGTLVLTRAIRRRIEAVRLAAEAIVEGDLRARVPVEAPDSAFGRQAVTFNRMLDRIEALMDSLRGLSNDIAHDLRTPIARLHGRLVAIAQQPQAAPLADALADAVAQAEEILALFAAILRIAEVEGGSARGGFAPIDLAGWAREAGEALAVMVEDSGRAFSVAVPDAPVWIDGDVRLLSQLLVNLVENAVHHTPPGTRIAVTVSTRPGEAVLAVIDNGPGIAAAARAQALRRFGRLDASRSRPGHGLGLSLVQAIAALHRGTLALDDAGPGLAVRLSLPRNG